MNSRRVLITGASKGIGHSVAERLAAAGHRPVGLARAAPATFPGEFHAVDLGDRTATGSAVREVLRGGAVDAVVNNVGLVRPAMIGSVDLDDLADVYDLNVRVAVQVTQAVLPAMIERSWWRIVNVTSMVTVGRPDRTAYGAAKAALEFCSRAWAGELASTGITVNSVTPARPRPSSSGTPTRRARPARRATSPASRSAGSANRTSSRRPSASYSRKTPGSSPGRPCGWTAASARPELPGRCGSRLVGRGHYLDQGGGRRARVGGHARILIQLCGNGCTVIQHHHLPAQRA
ncbi:MAG: hypothetical protein QOC75_597, partial [Pseudonocardiales bacterium]|nr:hypothetical protein [Pseudonocardiales bacterium]